MILGAGKAAASMAAAVAAHYAAHGLGPVNGAVDNAYCFCSGIYAIISYNK